MIHPTYRSLDAPVKLLGLAWRQWLALIVGGSAVIAAAHYAGISTRPAISFCTIVIGVPLALAYLSEETGFGLGRLFVDLLRWRCEAQAFAPGAGNLPPVFVVRADQEIAELDSHARFEAGS